MKKKLLTAVLLCSIITMSCGCDLNVKVNKENESESAPDSQTTSSDVVSSDAISSDNGSSENGSAVGGNTSADSESSSVDISAEKETREPVLVCSENSFASIRTDIMDTDGELLLAAKDSSGAWGYINTNGEWVIQPQYADAYNFSCGYAAVYGADGKAHFIDKSGNLCVGDYDGIYNWGGFNGFNHGYARVYKGDEYQIIDTEGNVVNSAKTSLWKENGSQDLPGFSKGSDREKSILWYSRCGGKPSADIIATDFGILTRISAFSYKGEEIQKDNGIDYEWKWSRDKTIYMARGKLVYIFNDKNEQLSSFDAFDLYYEWEAVKAVSNNCFVQKCVGGYTIYDFNYTEITTIDAEELYDLGDDMFLIKNNVGNYAIVDKTGTELVPYTIGREPVKFSADKGNEYILEINDREYVVLWYPNAAVEPGEKPAYEFFDIEEKSIVEMDEIYATYIDYAFNVSGTAMILEKDGLLLTNMGIQYLVHDEQTDTYNVTLPELLMKGFRFGGSFDQKFCFENNLYIVDDIDYRIGHIEY
ncbi:MAG: WG repeat-containing protein [Oscillospiraceae bacterium]